MKKQKDKIDYKKYSGKLERAWRADRAEKFATIADQEASLGDWIDTAFDREDEIKKKDKLATNLFLLGLLLGVCLMNLLLMAWILV
jgi:hypothetical protein